MAVTASLDLRAQQLVPFSTGDDASVNLADFDAKLSAADAQPFFATSVHSRDLDVKQAAVAKMTTQPWVVVFVQSQETFLNPISRQARTNVLIMLSITFLVAAFGLYISKTVTDPIAHLTETVENIQGGDLGAVAALESQDEIGKLAAAFNDMTAQLRGFIGSLEQRVVERTTLAEKARAESESARLDLEEQVWLANGQTRLAEVIRGEQSISQMARNVLAHLCPYAGAQAGILFLLEDGRLSLAGSYSCMARSGFDGYVALGEGLAGQAAADGQVSCTAIPSDTMLISTGLGDLMPRQVTAVPFYMNAKVVGVLELATLSEFTQRHLELWNRISEMLGYAFHTVQTRERLARLLLESQQQAEELRAQEEELRAVNEELQAQAENLKTVRRHQAQKDKAA
jgi:nitrate/nitrite-specific signal transduction histidine kinase